MEKKFLIFNLNIIITYKFLNIDLKHNSLFLLEQFPDLEIYLSLLQKFALLNYT